MSLKVIRYISRYKSVQLLLNRKGDPARHRPITKSEICQTACKPIPVYDVHSEQTVPKETEMQIWAVVECKRCYSPKCPKERSTGHTALSSICLSVFKIVKAEQHCPVGV